MYFKNTKEHTFCEAVRKTYSVCIGRNLNYNKIWHTGTSLKRTNRVFLVFAPCFQFMLTRCLNNRPDHPLSYELKLVFWKNTETFPSPNKEN